MLTSAESLLLSLTSMSEISFLLGDGPGGAGGSDIRNQATLLRVADDSGA